MPEAVHRRDAEFAETAQRKLISMHVNHLTSDVIGAAIEVHRSLGPGLLESAYQECLARELVLRHIPFERERPLPLAYKGVRLECGYRIELLIGGRVVVEVKALMRLRRFTRHNCSPTCNWAAGMWGY